MLVSRPLAGRYAFTKRIRGTQRTIIWLARDQRTGHSVVASVLPGPRAAALEPALDLSHVHAASILRIVDSPERDEIPGDEPVDPGARVVVAEHIPGRSLQQRLDAGPVATETAVEWIASIADALSLLHARGAVHGAVSPRALIVIRSEPAVVPILTHLIIPPSGAFCSPERVTGGGPSEIDDSWALAATLYAALSRRAPFQGASRKELAQAIVQASPERLGDLDPRLWDITRRSLLSDPKERLSTAAGIRDALRDWMDQTGARSLGDFAPVTALVGASEPGPNVGDLSLVAALERPESAEATAPFRIIDSAAPEEPSRPADADIDDLTAEALGMSPSAMGANGIPALSVPSLAPPRLSEPPPASGPRRVPVPFPLPKTGSRSRHPARKRNVMAVVGLLALVAVGSAGAGLVAGKLRGTAKRQAITEKARSEARATRESAGATETATTEPHTVTLPAQTGGAGMPGSAPSSSSGRGDGVGAPSASSVLEGTAPPPAPSAGTDVAEAGSSEPFVMPTTPAGITACARSVLPEGTLGASADLDVGYLCTEGELWGIARKLDLTIAKHGQGPGMVLWAHLGRYDLAAIAVLLRRCCPAETVFTAASPRGVCQSLPSSVQDVSRDQSAQNIDRYAESVDCFISRGVRYPAEWWDRVGPKDARGYFEEYLRGLRKP